MNSDRVWMTLTPILRPLVLRLGRGRRELFAATPVAKGSTVFLGDSITEGGQWEEWFGGVNRGISGDTTEEVLARLDTAIDQPAVVNLLIGTNDLQSSRYLRDLDGIASRVEQIVTRIRQQAPSATILLNGVMPRTTLLTSRIHDLNERYRQIAERTASVYVDLWPALADETGAIRPELTKDNLHLSPAGYAAWVAVLRPLLAAA